LGCNTHVHGSNTRNHPLPVGRGDGRREVAQIMYIHESKCKNDKIIKKENKTSLIHFVLILAEGNRLGSSFSLLQVEIQFSQHHSLKGCLFFSTNFGQPCQKLDGCRYMGLCEDCLFSSIGSHVCFCVTTMQFLLLWLCTIVEVRYCDVIQDCFGYVRSFVLQHKL
jgi:hypothetical protein